MPNYEKIPNIGDIFPKLTTAERDALTPTKKMRIFNTTTDQYEVYNGASWNAEGAGGGEANTASNLGAGTALASAKVGANLPFKSLVGGLGITLTNDANTVTFTSGSDNNVITDAAANRTLVITDKDMYIQMTNAGANTITVPDNATVPFPIGTIVEGEWNGVGQTAFVAGGGVTINSADGNLKIEKRYQVAGLKKVAVDTWTLVGPLVA